MFFSGYGMLKEANARFNRKIISKLTNIITVWDRQTFSRCIVLYLKRQISLNVR